MKKAVILTIDEDTQEIRSLLDTLSVTVIREFLQKRDRPHMVSFLGPGKIDEVLEEIKELEVDLIVVNGLLKPSQHHFLEMKFQMECIDRPGVILRIFANHAHTPEAVAQVTLATLRYELPFLREWVHKAKSGDRPGFLAGGAYATDVYFEHAKTHARRIERSLEELSRQREITRANRRAKGYSLVSIAGYTNAGKSALMNMLCNSSVEVDSRLFSTLSTTTRRIAGVKGNVLMSDTVGFIRDLPPDLINAFNSTLEEIFYADLILLVFDASEPPETIDMKLKTSLKILLPKIRDRSLVVVANKIDLVSEKGRREMIDLVRPIIDPYELILVSSISSEGLDCLRERILAVQGYNCVVEANLPLTDEAYSLLSRLRSFTEVSSTIVRDSLDVTVRCKPQDAGKIIGWLNGVGGRRVTSTCGPAEEPTPRAPTSIGNEGAPLS